MLQAILRGGGAAWGPRRAAPRSRPVRHPSNPTEPVAWSRSQERVGVGLPRQRLWTLALRAVGSQALFPWCVSGPSSVGFHSDAALLEPFPTLPEHGGHALLSTSPPSMTVTRHLLLPPWTPGTAQGSAGHCLWDGNSRPVWSYLEIIPEPARAAGLVGDLWGFLRKTSEALVLGSGTCLARGHGGHLA